MTKKRKFKINIVDLLVVLVVITLIVAASVKFGKYNTKTDESSETTILYTLSS